MDNANSRADEQPIAPETPEDVAILYSWANLPGAKYRDFSASRREYRAQQRARAAEAQRQTELQAARELEEAAQREIEKAQKQVEATRQAEAKAAADAAAEAEAKRRAEEVLQRAEQNAERERQEALRRQQSAEELRVMAERAQEEMLEARKRAEEQAARYAESEQSKDQSAQNRTLPGETSDPYYYSGPVDPAYFASTPGVRTAQAARVSTERKAYVWPVHPGSEEFDSGTVVAYRGNPQFAPSPSQMDSDREQALHDDVADLPKSEATSGKPASRRVHENADYDLDYDYYDGDHVARTFSPSPRASFGVRRNSAPADLHIRPATRASGEHVRTSRVRPSLLGQPLQTRVEQPLPNLFPDEPAVTENLSDPVTQKYSPETVFLSTDAANRREIPAPRAAEKTNLVSSAEFLPSLNEPLLQDEVRPKAIRFEEQETAAEDLDGSRMFLPTPRRHVLQSDVEPTVEQTRMRDVAAEEGQRRSQAEADSRAAFDRFVHRQETGSARASDMSSRDPADDMIKPSDLLPPAEQPVQWRSVNRVGESGFRRRRQPGREPAVRTVRQPRAAQDTQASYAGTEQSAPPAWLSGEQVPPSAADSVKVEGGAGPDVPAIQGDPDVPVPRPVIRPAPSSLRPRVSSSTLAAKSGETSSEPSLPTAGLRPGQDSLASSADTLQQSRERVASRWFALSGLMGADGKLTGDSRTGVRSASRPAPVLSVLSISGGVGKTSIVATLGRALSSMGEKVMLADTNVHGILPYYFGAREQKPGAVRTFTPPPGSSDAPVVLVSYDADGRAYDETGQNRVLEDLHRRSNEVQRVLVDAGVNSAWLARAVAGTNPWVLVPVAPDMNSVLGTQAVERLFQDVTGADGKPVKPYYVLNQYDPTMPLHLDVREVLRQFLGERLLPIMLHRTPVISEALAEGMTVIDYAPRAPITTDYMNLAAWVRKLADPGLSYARPARWSER